MKTLKLFISLKLLLLTAITVAQIDKSHFGASSATWAGSEGWSNFQNLNVHYMRMPIDIQKGVIVDNIFLNQYDNYVTTAQSKNIIIYGIINPKKNGSNQFPTKAEFYNAVKTIIEHYDGDGTNDMTGLTIPIKNWETCNEVTPGTGLYAGFTITDYLNYVDTSRNALTQTCADCKLFNGAQVGPPSGSSQSFFTSTLDDLITGKGTNIIDGISYHDYLINFETDSAINDFTTLGIQSKPIWLTEAGMQEEYVANNSLTQDDNAKLFVKSAVYAFHKGVEKIIYASVRAQTIDPAYVKWQSLMEPTTGCKRKIYYSFKKLIEKTDYFTAIDTIFPNNDSSVFAYKFTVNSKPVYVLWAKTNQSVNINLSSPSISEVSVTNSVPLDTNGNFTVQSKSAASGVLSIDISSEAVYIEEVIPTKTEPDKNSISEIKLFPNPSDEYIIVGLESNNYKNTCAKIYNTNGQIIKETIISNTQNKINIKDLSPGIYFIEIRGTYRKFTKIKCN